MGAKCFMTSPCYGLWCFDAASGHTRAVVHRRREGVAVQRGDRARLGDVVLSSHVEEGRQRRYERSLPFGAPVERWRERGHRDQRPGDLVWAAALAQDVHALLQLF